MGRMFLIEILIHKFEFEETIHPLPKSSDLIVSISFADIMKTDMILADFPNPGFGVLDHDYAVGLNMGKAYLFEYNSAALTKDLKKFPLEFTLKINKVNVGSCQMPWKEDFINMVNLYETVGVVKSVEFCGSLPIQDAKEKLIAKMFMFTRMTCFGDRTNSDIIPPRSDGEVMIVASTKTSHKMECTGCDWNTPDFFLNTAIFKTAVQYLPCDVFYVCSRREIPIIHLGTEEPANLLELFGQQSDLDVISISFRPSDSRLYDLLHTISDLPRQDEKTERSFYVEDDRDTVKSHLAEKINTMKFCKNENCPGNIKFKEYGIGHLHPERVSLEPVAPCTLSHANGSIFNYGPESRFSRPKRAEQPFIPAGNISHSITMQSKTIISKEPRSCKKK